jgi:hypothetical protein
MVDGSPATTTTHLVWDANAAAFRPPQPGSKTRPDRFIKGPIPLPWFVKAAALPGKAPIVALVLWWIRGLCRSATFPLKRQATNVFSVSPDAAYDALKRLEEAGLIRVLRHCGRSPVVTVLDVSD